MATVPDWAHEQVATLLVTLDFVLPVSLGRGISVLLFKLFIAGSNITGHCCLRAGVRTISQGVTVFMPISNKVYICTLTRLTFMKYILLSFSMPSGTESIHCGSAKNEDLETVYDLADSNGWILGSCFLKGVSGSRSALRMHIFGIQK